MLTDYCNIKSKHVSFIKAFIPVFLLLFYYQTSLGIGPVVADETVYKSLINEFEWGPVTIPDYLFYILYKPVVSHGEMAYGYIRLLNICMFGVSSFYFYRTACLYIRASSSYILLLIYLCQPFVIYSFFLMPEMLYLLGFSFLIFTIGKSDQIEGYDHYKILLIAATLAILSFVKPHAIFIFFCIALYFAIKSILRSGYFYKWHRVVIFILAFVLLKLIHNGKRIGIIILLTTILSLMLVFFPEYTNFLANQLGVGRGADLLLYVSFGIGLLLMLVLPWEVHGRTKSSLCSI